MDQKLLTFLTLCRTMNYRRAADALQCQHGILLSVGAKE